MVSLATACVVLLACMAAPGPAPAPAAAQYRPSYFPRPGGFSQELPQYGGAAAGAAGVQGGDADIGNRDNAPHEPPLPAPGMSNSLDDKQLANRVPEWPRPQQPFWFLNQQHIAQHTAQAVPCQGRGCPLPAPGPAPQSSFISTAARTSRG